ncbi:radical SAM protein [Trichloromonas sp.]|uniref:radical SAM protein n=1 Tax=Trichloromonas sp. TaxID=3069249 RepID=UPI002A4CC5D4|nr:radical SAM protein [Trichloromonas sp.]
MGHVYGPVPSRRLGRSLGVDLVPFKVCSYDCIYCQLGRTTEKTLERREYVPITEIMADLEGLLAQGVRPDYISLAGSGEPTLNSGIGELIRKIKAVTPIPVAVLTNGSLLWRDDVQEELLAADLVLPSLDAGDAALFELVNRPHAGISFARMVEGLETFTRRFPGEVWLEVLLLGGVTGIFHEVEKINALIERIQPNRVQLNTVARPPVEDFAYALSLKQMRALQQAFTVPVELIGGIDQGNAAPDGASAAGAERILALLERRPCTCDDLARGLGIHVLAAMKELDPLLATGQIQTVVIGGKHFYRARPEEREGVALP